MDQPENDKDARAVWDSVYHSLETNLKRQADFIVGDLDEAAVENEMGQIDAEVFLHQVGQLLDSHFAMSMDDLKELAPHRRERLAKEILTSEGRKIGRTADRIKALLAQSLDADSAQLNGKYKVDAWGVYQVRLPKANNAPARDHGVRSGLHPTRQRELEEEFRRVSLLALFADRSLAEELVECYAESWKRTAAGMAAERRSAP